MKEWLLRRPRVAAALMAALFLLPGPLLLELELDNAPESYFPEDAPAVVFDNAVRERFPQEQVLIALFEGEGLFEPAFLQRLHAASQELESLSAVERVLSVTSADHIRAVEDGFSVETLIDTGELDERSPEEWRERALSDRFAPGMLISHEGDALALVVRPHRLEDSLQRLELEQALRTTLERNTLEEELTAVAGHIALDVAQLRSMIRDTAAFIPATTGIGLLLLWWMFRRWLVVGLALVTIGIVVNGAVVLFVLLGKPYTLVSSIVPPLLSALTIAMLMHLFNAVRHAAQRGFTGEARVRRALEVVARPTLFTALTTAAGLISLTLSPIRPIGSFGLVAAAGIILAAVVVLYLLPPLIVRWDRGEWTQRGGMGFIDTITRMTSRVAIRNAGWVVAAAVVLLVVGVPQIRHVIVETDLYAFFAEDHPISQDTRRVEDNLSGVMPLEVVFSGEGRDSLVEPERIRHMQRVQEWLDDQPEVDYSLSMTDMVEQMHWAFHDEDPAFLDIPDDRPLISQYLFVYDGRDLHDVVDRDHEQARILLNLNAHGARELNALIDRIDGYLAEQPPGDLQWDLAGMGRLFADQERLLIDGQLRSLIAVTVLIFALMLILWRSVSAAALTMLPNMAPVLVIFIVMGTLGIWLDVATAMIASVAIGIAVDDTIHTYHGYARHRTAGAPVPWALARTFRQGGRAVIATTVVLCAQFLVLGFSQFQPTAAFGVLTAVGLMAALLFDLLLLPAMLVLLNVAGRRREGRKVSISGPS